MLYGTYLGGVYVGDGVGIDVSEVVRLESRVQSGALRAFPLVILYCLQKLRNGNC